MLDTELINSPLAEALSFHKYLPNPKLESAQKKLSSNSEIIGEPSKERGNNGRFLPGNHLAPGRIPGRYDFFPALARALQRVEKNHGISLIAHAVERAYKNDAVMIAILKKILPDLTSDTGMKGPQIVQIMLTHRADLETYSQVEKPTPVEKPAPTQAVSVAEGEASKYASAGDRATTGPPEAQFSAAPAQDSIVPSYAAPAPGSAAAYFLASASTQAPIKEGTYAVPVKEASIA